MQDDSDLIPARAVNAFVFCPRLYWLEHVAGQFADNEHTVEGRHVHRRVDQPGGKMPAPQGGEEGSDGGPDGEGEGPPWHTRSLWLSSEAVGVTGIIDLVEPDDTPNRVMPVDTKKGKPTPEGGLWPADAVQLTLQGLLLRAHGYEVAEIAAWYHSARKRVVEPLTPERIEEARLAVEGARACATLANPPDPLVDSPKCPGCSLHAICQPDEVNALLRHNAQDSHSDSQSSREDEPIRRVFSPRDDALPVYVQDAGARVGLAGECLKITPRSSSEITTVQEVGFGQISQLNLLGTVQISTQALQACLQNDVPVAFFSSGGWFYGKTEGLGHRQVQVRIAQYQHHQQERALAIARVLVADKIANARTLLRRNADEGDFGGIEDALEGMDQMRRQAETATNPASLLGIEGQAARLYWSGYSAALESVHPAFRMDGRNRRPPRDPTNAMLSFGYALLTKDCTLAVGSAGLDPYLGVFHTPHHGRPAMALDLMEVFRPLVVDSAVLTMVRRGWVDAGDFTVTGQGVAMKPSAKRKVIQTYERRMDELVTHPVFGYRISYRRVLYVQARLLARVLTGEIPSMPSFRTR